MIVGLGNPGRTYEDTRHNAGFMVLDRLAARWGAVFKADRQRKCEVAAGPGVLLVKPSTFMNESGQCVGPMMRFFKLDPRSVFVIHDEVDFPLGVIKLREKGSGADRAADGRSRHAVLRRLAGRGGDGTEQSDQIMSGVCGHWVRKNAAYLRYCPASVAGYRRGQLY